MKKDLLIVGLILCLIVSIGTHIQSYNELKKEVGFKLEAMQFAIDLNKMNDEYIIMIDSLNEELDAYMFLDRLKDQLGKYQEGLKN